MSTPSKSRAIIEIAIVLGIMLGVKDVLDRFEVIAAGSIAMWVGIGTSTLFMRQHGITWKSFGLTLPKGGTAWLKTLGIALATVVGVLVFMLLIMPLVGQIVGVEVPDDAKDRFAFLVGQPLKFIAYLVVVIWLGAAMGEELMMRGFLLNYLGNFFGDSKKGWVLAVVVHAAVFGSLHIYQGIYGVIGTGIVAVVFAVVYLRVKRKLVPVILAHGILNSLSLTAYYLSGGIV